MDSKPLPGNKPGLELKVAVDHGLVGELARLKFELFYGLGKVKFQKPLSQVKKVAKKAKMALTTMVGGLSERARTMTASWTTMVTTLNWTLKTAATKTSASMRCLPLEDLSSARAAE